MAETKVLFESIRRYNLRRKAERPSLPKTSQALQGIADCFQANPQNLEILEVFLKSLLKTGLISNGAVIDTFSVLELQIPQLDLSNIGELHFLHQYSKFFPRKGMGLNFFPIYLK